ncbi:MAG: hypothetical protein IJB52_07090 [Clostridia bacterium]|nr:hypothetical protein [Clostridia bacterium]
MNKEHIENIFKSFLTKDGCTNFSDKHFYNCRPLIKSVNGAQIEYGFSLSLFGVMALHCQYNGKWAEYIDITSHCYKSIDVTGIAFSGNEWYHVKSDPIVLTDLLSKIYRYCRNNATSEFDCCSLYLECSNLKKCINPRPERGMLCSYRKKLENGIIFYGINRTKKG